jgi:23S rRNA (cytidine1920-2'-O)/16S rRNA (cytidine1409-2'-O)-methyltransferase
MRLDQYLVKHQYVSSRNKALELIKNSKVLVDNQTITKPSFKITNQTIQLLSSKIYVSRSALKLKYFLDELNINLSNDHIALDIGSSTGGFSEVLLEYGIKDLNIYCVDVGSNQLDTSLRDRVHLYEQTDIRNFDINKKFDIITCDVSFISVVSIFEYIDKLARDKIIVLFKPQFEVGRTAKRDSNGVVTDNILIGQARQRFLQEASKLNWELIYTNKSQVFGKNGNLEELFYFRVND